MSDFSRQLKVHGMDADKQARLAQARVLVFGAGGLAATAIPWLAAAGVGQITVVDGDTIAESNLHRQLPFTPADIGRHKAEAMAAYCQARMIAGGQCTAIGEELHGEALLHALQAHDIALDCTDSRTLAYQLNDAALLSGKPVVFANAAAMGGQLFTLHPGEDQPCWRCLWPESVLPGGNCEALGVMGPVPAVFGLYQALEALKVLTGFAPPLMGEVLQYDFVAMRQMRFAVPRAPACNHKPSLEKEDWRFAGDFAAAQAQGLRIIDIRRADEWAARALPVADACITMDDLLARPEDFLAREEAVLLVCAAGLRAQASARLLREAGFARVFAYPRGW